MCDGTVSGKGESQPCRELAFWFAFLVTSEIKVRDGRRIRIRALDSYKSALDGITLRELGRIESETKALVRKINNLKRTPLVRELNDKGVISSDDVLGKTDFPCESRFQALLNLKHLAARVLGDPRKPRKHDFDADLSRIYRCIHDHAGRWHDERVADILNDLLRTRAEPFTQPGLKQWRYKNGLTDPK
jgi:hypothetical protein